MNISCDSDVTERSKSNTDKDCIGADITCKVERNVTAVVPGHSKKRPAKWKALKVVYFKGGFGDREIFFRQFYFLF